MPSYSFNTNYSANKGSALAIGLTILTAITLISVTALQRSGIQTRMVGNIQHKEQGFHAANGELEEIYQFYSTQASATEALASAKDKHTIVDGEKVPESIAPGHTSTYNNYDHSSSGGYPASARLQLTSSVQHTDTVKSLVAGFSVGSFVEYEFVVNAQSSKPDIGNTPGNILSSQEIGIKYIAPAGS